MDSEFEEKFVQVMAFKKVKVFSNHDYMDVTVSTETRRGHNRLDIVLKKAVWHDGGLDIQFVSHPSGMVCSVALLDECVPALIAALQRINKWEPTEKPESAETETVEST